MLFSSLFLLTAFSASIGSAHDSGKAAAKHKGDGRETHCYTSFAFTKTKHVPTVTHYHTVTAKRTKTVHTHTTKTITPPPKTKTSTKTSTSVTTVTESTETDTATVTSTVFTTTTIVESTETDTITATATTTTTTTLDASVSTIAAPAGFLPIQTTLPNSMYKKRELDMAQLKARSLLKRGKAQGLCGKKPKPKNPSAVECEVYTTTTITKTITKTDEPCTSTAHRSTITSTITSTFTSTSSVFPSDVTSTVTATSTSTVSSTTTPVTSTTTTTTSTVTSTETPPSSTTYAQCATNNFMSQGPTAGNYVTNGDPGDANYNESTTDDQDPYSCCVSCALLPNCAISFFVYPLAGGPSCVVISIDTCTAGQGSYSLAASDYSDQGPQYEWSNGQCGSFNAYES